MKRRWVVTLAALPCIAIGMLIRPIRVRTDRVPQRLDAIVVLHGGYGTDSTLSSISVARLDAGIALAHAVPSALVVLTRNVGLIHGVTHEASSDQRKRIAMAGLLDRWRLTDYASNTREEATVSARILLPDRPNIAVVTSAVHTVRACATFERVGFHVTCVADVEERGSLWSAAFFNAYEHAAYIKYWLRGYVGKPTNLG
jgi:uncharacterized SAM-binding protein YcdF (DUF218 family)